MILVLLPPPPLGHGIVHPVITVVLFFLPKSVFLEGTCLKLPKLGTPRKNVVHLYRSTRQLPLSH